MTSRRFGSTAQQLAGRVEPVEPRHPDVHQHHVGPQLGRGRRRRPRPSAASPTTSRCRLRRPASRSAPTRTSGSSSTMRTRIGDGGHGGHGSQPRSTKLAVRRCDRSSRPPRSSARSVSPISPSPDARRAGAGRSPSGLRNVMSTPSSGDAADLDAQRPRRERACAALVMPSCDDAVDACGRRRRAAVRRPTSRSSNSTWTARLAGLARPAPAGPPSVGSGALAALAASRCRAARRARRAGRSSASWALLADQRRPAAQLVGVEVGAERRALRRAARSARSGGPARRASRGRSGPARCPEPGRP